MEKPAVPDYPIHDLMVRRWSPRAFLPSSVEPEKLRSLFEAARWAPSCFNEQPWRFLVSRREDTGRFREMIGCLTPGNQAWAGAAGALILSVASGQFAHNGRANRHAFHDVGLATAQLVLQATALGLGIHQMAGFDRDRARGIWKIPEPFDPVAMVAVGYPGEPEQLSGELAQRERAPRTRRSQSGFVFGGGWESAWDHADS
jgi:nitroreductase